MKPLISLKNLSVDIFYYCYNQAPYIDQALNSILNQDIESKVNLYICDDGSSDNSNVVIDAWLQRNDIQLQRKDWNVKVLTELPAKNIGQVETLKKGLGFCNSDYFAILEGDDNWQNTSHLSILVRYLAVNSAFVAAFSSWITIDLFGKIHGFRTPDRSNLANRVFGFEQLAIFNAPGTLSAMVYRGDTIRSAMTSIKANKYLSDFALNLTVSTWGPIYWSEEMGLIYTHNPQSIWRTKSSKDQNAEFNLTLNETFEIIKNRVGKSIEIERYFRKKTTLFKRIRYAISHPFKACILIVTRLKRN